MWASVLFGRSCWPWGWGQKGAEQAPPMGPPPMSTLWRNQEAQWNMGKEPWVSQGPGDHWLNHCMELRVTLAGRAHGHLRLRSSSWLSSSSS